MPDCLFCERVRSGDVVAAGDGVAAFRDGYPVTNGHTLVVPTAHQPDFFALSPQDQASAWALVTAVRRQLSEELGARCFTVGLNDGCAAGQTIGHAHIHVIPRTAGDVPDPRGGVRWVIPNRAAYWS